MRINELTSAEDTLTLWKMISDNTWAAITQQLEAEAKQKAERAAARKSLSKRGSAKSVAKPAPPKRLPPPLKHVSAPVAKDTKPATGSELKSSNQQLQQPAQRRTASSSNKVITPTASSPAVSATSNPVPLNVTAKKPLPQIAAQLNLSNGD